MTAPFALAQYRSTHENDAMKKEVSDSIRERLTAEYLQDLNRVVEWMRQTTPWPFEHPEQVRNLIASLRFEDLARGDLHCVKLLKLLGRTKALPHVVLGLFPQIRTQMLLRVLCARDFFSLAFFQVHNLNWRMSRRATYRYLLIDYFRVYALVWWKTAKHFYVFQ